MVGIAILFGIVVGFALGLTGGGGGVIAVPLLVYGLTVAPREAIGVSLASVGGTALFGVIPRLIRGQVELRTGFIFAIAGMAGAPIGNLLADIIPEPVLLLLFGLLMLFVASQMWIKTQQVASPRQTSKKPKHSPAFCQRDSDGKLIITKRCLLFLSAAGLIVGVLSGLFGVGGGFVIVPALVLYGGMKIHQAVATSLLVIALVSISGVISFVASGNELPWGIAFQFLVGGFIGMGMGGLVAKRLNGVTLQRVFAIGVVLVAIFVISKSLLIT